MPEPGCSSPKDKTSQDIQQNFAPAGVTRSFSGQKAVQKNPKKRQPQYQCQLINQDRDASYVPKTVVWFQTNSRANDTNPDECDNRKNKRECFPGMPGGWELLDEKTNQQCLQGSQKKPSAKRLSNLIEKSVISAPNQNDNCGNSQVTCQ